MKISSRNPTNGLHPVLGDGGGMFSIPSFPSDDSEMFGGNPMTVDPSSAAMLRGQHLAKGSSRSSWYEDNVLSKRLSCYEIIRLFFDSLLLMVIATGIVLAAYLPVDVEHGLRYGVTLPYLYAVFVAIAGYEFAWLVYLVRLKLFLPFKLYKKQTSREMYTQIIPCAVDLETCAITSMADKMFCGSRVFAAVCISIVATGGAVGLCYVPGSTDMPIIYIGVCTFVGMLSAALTPNIPTALCVLIRYAYFFLSSLNVVLRSNASKSGVFHSTVSGNESGSINGYSGGPNSRRAMDKYLAVVVESYSLLLLSVCLLLIVRAVTSKDSMDSALMIVLDGAGLLYLSCSSAVLQLFEQSTRVHASGALAGFFVIVWSAELGAFLTERILKVVQYPWIHPLSMVSSQQNIEKMVGAIGYAVGAAVLLPNFVEFDMDSKFVAFVSAAAVAVVSLIASIHCSLWRLFLLRFSIVLFIINHSGD
ncbi:unnamed protein product [Peronospora belbahrii]|uniref:Uncharacterized protein n=1 Tax=Peronospora belbahrii TaxID=622444 RepID=A0ABN8DBH4_9STRA|nr:unnamed protein product [Peronospora belbahrii]